MSKHSSSSHDAFSMYNLADAIYNNSYTLQEGVASSLDKGVSSTAKDTSLTIFSSL